MITPCKIIYPYYENYNMLDKQMGNWLSYSPELLNAVQFIIVDDCSQKFPAEHVLHGTPLPMQLWRVKERWPWNMHQCRNIGAFVAGTMKENPWLFMSDMDIMLTPEMATSMLSRKLKGTRHYTMERAFAPDFTERKVHCNTFLVRHQAYWKVNGYDLDFTPVGGGGYGGDGVFLRQLASVVPADHLMDVVLIGYGRRTRDGKPFVEDADTAEWDRDEWNKKYRLVFDRKRKYGDLKSVNPIRTPYERVPL